MLIEEVCVVSYDQHCDSLVKQKCTETPVLVPGNSPAASEMWLCCASPTGAGPPPQQGLLTGHAFIIAPVRTSKLRSRACLSPCFTVITQICPTPLTLTAAES